MSLRLFFSLQYDIDLLNWEQKQEIARGIGFGLHKVTCDGLLSLYESTEKCLESSARYDRVKLEVNITIDPLLGATQLRYPYESPKTSAPTEGAAEESGSSAGTSRERVLAPAAGDSTSSTSRSTRTPATRPSAPAAGDGRSTSTRGGRGENDPPRGGPYDRRRAERSLAVTELKNFADIAVTMKEWDTVLLVRAGVMNHIGIGSIKEAVLSALEARSDKLGDPTIALLSSAIDSAGSSMVNVGGLHVKTKLPTPPILPEDAGCRIIEQPKSFNDESATDGAAAHSSARSAPISSGDQPPPLGNFDLSAMGGNSRRRSTTTSTTTTSSVGALEDQSSSQPQQQLGAALYNSRVFYDARRTCGEAGLRLPIVKSLAENAVLFALTIGRNYYHRYWATWIGMRERRRVLSEAEVAGLKGQISDLQLWERGLVRLERRNSVADVNVNDEEDHVLDVLGAPARRAPAWSTWRGKNPRNIISPPRAISNSSLETIPLDDFEEDDLETNLEILQRDFDRLTADLPLSDDPRTNFNRLLYAATSGHVSEDGSIYLTTAAPTGVYGNWAEPPSVVYIKVGGLLLIGHNSTLAGNWRDMLVGKGGEYNPEVMTVCCDLEKFRNFSTYVNVSTLEKEIKVFAANYSGLNRTNHSVFDLFSFGKDSADSGDGRTGTSTGVEEAPFDENPLFWPVMMLSVATFGFLLGALAYRCYVLRKKALRRKREMELGRVASGQLSGGSVLGQPVLNIGATPPQLPFDERRRIIAGSTIVGRPAPLNELRRAGRNSEAAAAAGQDRAQASRVTPEDMNADDRIAEMIRKISSVFLPP